MSKSVSSERSVSVWMEESASVGEPLHEGRTADLVVVGGGMAGLSIAYEALQQGRKVMILDRGPIAAGMTARTTAHLASALDDRYYKFIGLRGEAEAKLLYQSQAAAIDRIEQIIRSENIDCDFARCDGYLFLGEGDSPDILEKEYEACHKIGFTTVAWADRAPMPDKNTGRCLRFPNQARIHPLKYLNGLVRAVKRLGGELYPFTAVDSIVQSEGGSVTVALRNGNKIIAVDVADATNAPIAGRLTLQTKMAPYRSYVVAMSLPKDAIEDALYWDTLDAYHYVRLQPGKETDVLIVGGEDHKTGEADDADKRFAALETWARERFSHLRDVIRSWSGQVLEPYDFAGFVGRDPDNDHVYFVTGDSGQGITNGAVAGLLIPALMQGEHGWEKLYDPARVTPAAAGTYVSENTTAAKNMVEHLGGPLLESAEHLKPGEGGLVRDGLSKIGAYRDEKGELHKVSATCTHVNCVVHWNSLERCWDCPCHGSHFGPDGEVLNAPATSPLRKVS